MDFRLTSEVLLREHLGAFLWWFCLSWHHLHFWRFVFPLLLKCLLNFSWTAFRSRAYWVSMLSSLVFFFSVVGLCWLSLCVSCQLQRSEQERTEKQEKKGKTKGEKGCRSYWRDDLRDCFVCSSAKCYEDVRWRLVMPFPGHHLFEFCYLYRFCWWILVMF